VTVDCDFKKWGDRQHYRFDAEHLGTDGFGRWLGCRPPTPMTGPRGHIVMEHGFVMLVPDEQWWLASFNDDRSHIHTYVDITSPSTWTSESRLTAIDLDLDVIRYWDGRVLLDDEDEFDEHRIAYGYPEDVVSSARRAADEILEAVTSGREPFGEVGRRWLEKL
jgi:hypothetical protein